MRKLPFLGLTILLTGRLILPAGAEAQNTARSTPTPTEREVLVAVAGHVVSGLTEGRDLPRGSRVVLDPAMPGSGLLGSGEPRGLWEDTVVRSIAARIGAAAGDGLPSRECDDAPVPTCRLIDVDAVIRLGRPRIDGDRAVIPVVAIYRSPSAPDPYEAHYTLKVYRVEQGPEGWQVIGAAMTEIS